MLECYYCLFFEVPSHWYGFDREGLRYCIFESIQKSYYGNPRPKAGLQWWDENHRSRPVSSLESRGEERSRYAENHTTPSIFAPNWDHPAGFSIASDLNTSKDAPKKCGTPLRSKLWSVKEPAPNQDWAVQTVTGCCRSRLVRLPWWVLDGFRVWFRSVWG